MRSRLECPRCQAEITPATARCQACGAATGRQANDPENRVGYPGPVPSSADRRPIIDNPYAVLAAVFLAMAILGIPLIWMCRAWSPPVKVLLTLLTLAYTALILWLFGLAMMWVYGRFQEAGIVLLQAHTANLFA